MILLLWFVCPCDGAWITLYQPLQSTPKKNKTIWHFFKYQHHNKSLFHASEVDLYIVSIEFGYEISAPSKSIFRH